MAVTALEVTHPVLRAAASMQAALDEAADVEPAFLTTAERGEALIALERTSARLTELRLRLLAASDDVAHEAGARDPAAWLAHAARGRPEDARADLRLARALDRRYLLVRAALRRGEANHAQATAVVRVLDDLPADLDRDVRLRAEQHLVELCGRFGPRELRRLGRHLLTVVAPEVADEIEGRRLEAEEDAARAATRLSLRRQGDGTTRLSGRLPDAVAARLLTCLGAFTGPRAPGGGAPRVPHPRRLGEGFARLLECLDPRRLPLHGGDATTLVVTVDLASLLRDLGTAGVVASGVPGSDAELRISAREARRLACTAGVLPVVLGGAGEVLDLGRARRLFSRAQRRALLLRDRTCRAEGCDVPGTWTEAHHWVPWSRGGPTDLADGVLLCPHHHHRAHDPAFTADRMPDGRVRFARRT